MDSFGRVEINLAIKDWKQFLPLLCVVFYPCGNDAQIVFLANKKNILHAHLKYTVKSFANANFPFFRWGLRPQPDGIAITNRTKGQAFRLLANPNVCILPENLICLAS